MAAIIFDLKEPDKPLFTFYINTRFRIHERTKIIDELLLVEHLMLKLTSEEKLHSIEIMNIFNYEEVKALSFLKKRPFFVYGNHKVLNILFNWNP